MSVSEIRKILIALVLCPLCCPAYTTPTSQPDREADLEWRPCDIDVSICDNDTVSVCVCLFVCLCVYVCVCVCADREANLERRPCDINVSICDNDTVCDCVTRCISALIQTLVNVILSHNDIQCLTLSAHNSHIELGNPSMPCVHTECHRFTHHHTFMCNALTLHYHLHTVHKPLITAMTWLSRCVNTDVLLVPCS